MADVVTGNTQLGATKQDLILALVQKELKFAAKLLPTVTDLSAFAVKGSKSVSYPKLTSFTVVNRASGVQGDASALTAANDKLDLNFNAYVAWIIDSMDATQTTLDANMENMRRAAGAHGRYVDEQLLIAIEAAAFNNVGPGPITKAKILAARQYIAEADGDLSQTVLCVPPAQEAVMLGLADFVQADYYGSSNIPGGVIGRVYGMPVIVHNGVTSTEAFVWEKSGIAIAFQKSPQSSTQPANEFGVGAERTAVDQLFGIKGLQLGEKGAGATQSPLIVKMTA